MVQLEFSLKKENHKSDKSINSLLKDEENGLKNPKIYEEFGKKVQTIRENVKRNINKLKSNGKRLIGYGYLQKLLQR